MEEKVKKRQLSNIARLETIKRRRQESSYQQKLISASLKNLDLTGMQPKRIIFEENDIGNEINCLPVKKEKNETDKLLLFSSSESECEDNDADRFRIRKQFEGERGKQLLERSSEITDDRFKLDERFKEDDDDNEYTEKSDLNAVNEETKVDILSERERNFEILEEILGFQVSKKCTAVENNKTRKRYLRYDPESENASQFIKQSEVTEERKEHNKVKKAKIKEAAPVHDLEPMVPKERYFEVKKNLKEIIGKSSGNFSLLEKFSVAKEIKNECSSGKAEVNDTVPSVWEKGRLFEKVFIEPLKDDDKTLKRGTKEEDTDSEYEEHMQNVVKKNEMERSENCVTQKKSTFFVNSGDPRLKEGIDFFRRTETKDVIKEKWLSTRRDLVEMHRKRQRMAKRNKEAKIKNAKRQRQFSKRL